MRNKSFRAKNIKEELAYINNQYTCPKALPRKRSMAVKSSQSTLAEHIYEASFIIRDNKNISMVQNAVKHYQLNVSDIF